MSEEREILSWEMFGVASRDLAQTVADDGYEPDMILSIARGGLLIGGALGYALSVKNTYTMNVEFYTGVDERLEVPRIMPPAPDFVDLHNAQILIVDDVADTGHTLKSVEKFCEGKVGDVRTAVIYEKSHSLVKCDYVWKRTDLWINFPWSDKPPVAKRDWAVTTPDRYRLSHRSPPRLLAAATGLSTTPDRYRWCYRWCQAPFVTASALRQGVRVSVSVIPGQRAFRPARP